MLKDYIYELKRIERDSYRKKIREIEKNKKKHLLIKLMEVKLSKAFKDCIVTKNIESYGKRNGYCSLYLNKDYNIGKDVALFLETEEKLLTTIGGSKEYTVKHDQHSNSMDYIWKNFSLYVYYGNGKCKRVKVGEKSRYVKEDIYEIECL